MKGIRADWASASCQRIVVVVLSHLNFVLGVYRILGGIVDWRRVLSRG